MMNFLQSDIFRMIVVGTVVGFTAAMIGVFVILRKLSYFPDALAHATLAGIALGILFHFNIIIGAAALGLIMALGIATIERKKILGLDTIIVIFFTTALAIAVIISELIKVGEDQLFGYLFGDITKINFETFILSISVAVLTIFILIFKFKKWTKISFHEDLATIEGINVAGENYLFMLLLALFIAISMQVAGTLLIGPLLVIPAATANNFGQGFKWMFILAIIFSLISVILGIFSALLLNISVGPAIVIVAAILFIISLFFKR